MYGVDRPVRSLRRGLETGAVGELGQIALGQQNLCLHGHYTRRAQLHRLTGEVGRGTQRGRRQTHEVRHLSLELTWLIEHSLTLQIPFSSEQNGGAVDVKRRDVPLRDPTQYAGRELIEIDRTWLVGRNW